MPLSPKHLRDIPLFVDMSEEHLNDLCALFTRRQLPEGGVLFRRGDRSDTLSILTEGEVSLYEGEHVRLRLHPPAPIGELGSLTRLRRNTTAAATKASEVWQVSREALFNFFKERCDIAFPFYHSLLQIVADKVHRDDVRIEDMRSNIINTQKAMKRMRESILDAAETPLSEELHDTLERHIARNRKVNYRVEPVPSLPSHVRCDNGERADILEMSRTHLLLFVPQSCDAQAGDSWSAVLCFPADAEMPFSGTVVERRERRLEIELDMLIPEYGDSLDEYLTRVQLLDFVV
jgi:CRP/FNR family cyclic AMP-dependent transcriptional regulator